jgi:hypothetical protein
LSRPQGCTNQRNGSVSFCGVTAKGILGRYRQIEIPNFCEPPLERRFANSTCPMILIRNLNRGLVRSFRICPLRLFDLKNSYLVVNELDVDSMVLNAQGWSIP